MAEVGVRGVLPPNARGRNSPLRPASRGPGAGGVTVEGTETQTGHAGLWL